MAQPADQLVGRAAELGVIDHVLAELERRSFGALEIRGEPGMGKTRLLSELAGRGDALGQIVLSGSAAEFETDHWEAGPRDAGRLPPFEGGVQARATA